MIFGLSLWWTIGSDIPLPESISPIKLPAQVLMHMMLNADGKFLLFTIVRLAKAEGSRSIPNIKIPCKVAERLKYQNEEPSGSKKNTKDEEAVQMAKNMNIS